MSRKNIEEVVLFQIEKTSKTSKIYSQRDFDKLNLGITIEQWIILKIIEESKNISQKELAKKSLRDPASITRTLDLLEKKDLVRREKVLNNRRQYHIILTNNGAEFVNKNMPLITKHREKSIEGLTNKEIEDLKRILKKIQSNME
ncbi:MarR family winged helix-turn-helix transcriptional regulator [Aquimarina agarilytica]|uniref:MarR family winged helix-turn-helix transcriptional regulator n=1 Tax=Aquimarina agarilytica TaxID=1087449 RepID=UPI0002891119|nr:MarR family transcriptional regulator [Aquimarina agarilytica]